MQQWWENDSYSTRALLLKSVRYLFDIGYFIYPNMNTYIDVVP